MGSNYNINILLYNNIGIYFNVNVDIIKFYILYILFNHIILPG